MAQFVIVNDSAAIRIVEAEYLFDIRVLWEDNSYFLKGSFELVEINISFVLYVIELKCFSKEI